MYRRSWHSSPTNIDVVVVYPIDSLNVKNGDECVYDLLARRAKTIILASWTDNKDLVGHPNLTYESYL